MPEIVVVLTVVVIMVILVLLAMIVTGFKGVVREALRVEVVVGVNLFFVDSDWVVGIRWARRGGK
jgi:hypothetical protein